MILRGASVSGDGPEPHFLHDGVRFLKKCDRTIRMLVFRIIMIRDDRGAPEARSVHSIGVNFRFSGKGERNTAMAPATL